ncbi:FkbM family methyltransferase [Synechococcus sp. CCY9201]|uniref:FkbM family methyltransferase n=1 Tax=Synechococcus sp. CCY9201 TaxID=174697 RepID=UPI002B22177E|nr:FkbM family methyltransferase [Synechococcus sp. CCY9201]MEA5474675.1 FkbM family methyltransferase [Synechococcus sp. CCY9201]
MKKRIKQLMLHLLKKHALSRMPLSSELAKLGNYYHEYYYNVNHNPIENGEYWLLNMAAAQEADIIDVGAFIGEYSNYFLTHARQGRVIAVEPSIESYAALCSNLRSYICEANCAASRLLLFNCAASENDTDLEYFYSSTHPNGSTLNHAFANQPEFTSSNEFILRLVQAKSLDSIILASGLQMEAVALLKIDAEGHENAVLRGACNVLKTVGIVQIEYGMHNLSKRWLLKDIYCEYSSRFHIGRLYPSSIVISKDYDPKWEDFKGRNLVMLNKSSDAHPFAKSMLARKDSVFWL